MYAALPTGWALPSSGQARRRSGHMALLAQVAMLLRSVQADCECGYRVTVNSSLVNTTETGTSDIPTQYVLTDLIETNFANISDISKNTDWVRQEWNTTAAQSRGTYGQMMAVDNVVTNKGDGLQITVQAGEITNDLVPGGEIDSARTDIFYGTFRSSMKLTDQAGTVSAFFWVSINRSLAPRHLTDDMSQYFNDTQEIDMEFLSKDFHSSNASYPVNLVLQSRASAEAGYDASHTPTYQVVNLPFDPRADFHEYRMDFFPGRVLFLADGAPLAEMDSPAGIPTTAGHLAMNQWSNGNADWSGGPPTAADAVMTIRYVKAYFNSSDEARLSAYEKRCSGGGAAAGAVCDIPEVTPGNDSAAAWFFSGQKNMTENQTVSSDSGISGGDKSGGVRTRGEGTGWVLVGTSLVVVCWILGL